MWLHVPSTSSKYVLAAACAESAQVPPCNTSDAPPVVYVTSNGTDTPRPLSWVGWKTRPWIRRLSGTVLNRSTANRGADSWISQLRQSRAKETALLESDCLRTTNETSGPLPEQPCAIWNASTSFWKTSQGCLFPTEKGEEQPLSYGLSESWPRTGGTRNGTLFLRKRSERTTVENGYLCWPTADANAINGGESLESWELRRQRNILKHINGNGMGTPLAIEAMKFPANLWPTIAAQDGHRGKTPFGYEGHMGGENLHTAAQTFPPELWPTTDCNTATYSNWQRGENLRESSMNWPTARAEDAENCGNHPNAMDSLTGATKAFPMEPWATAMASDDGHKVTPASHQENLIGQSVRFPSSPQQEMTTSAGYGYSTLIQLLCQLFGVQSEEEFRAIPKQLNPRFVEFLLGWPAGWASTLPMETLAPTNSDYAETASAGRRQRKHS